MKKLFLLLLICGVSAFCADVPEITARATKADALYQAGETVVFRVSTADKAQSEAEYRYLLSGPAGLRQKGTVKLAAGQGKISVKSEKPGFLLLSIELPKRGAKRAPKPVLAGAGVEVEKIQPGTPECPQFKEFWEKEIRELRARPYKTVITEVKGNYDPRTKVYEVRLSDEKLAVTGYMVLPAKPVKGGHPILMMFNGAGTIGATYRSAVQRVIRYNMIVFEMSVHDVPNGLSPKEQAVIRRERKLTDYMYRGTDSPQEYSIREIFLRGVRALDFMKSRPEWNQKEVVTQGGSLGGAQALFAASIEPKAVLCIANAPALCDHYGALKGHLPGWPDMFNTLKRKKISPEKAKETMLCFDMVHIAKSIPCPVRLSVGFIDTICPPDSVCALFNSLTQKKSIANVVTGGHGPVVDPVEKSVFIQNMQYLDELYLPKKRK